MKSHQALVLQPLQVNFWVYLMPALIVSESLFVGSDYVYVNDEHVDIQLLFLRHQLQCADLILPWSVFCLTEYKQLPFLRCNDNIVNQQEQLQNKFS